MNKPNTPAVLASPQVAPAPMPAAWVNRKVIYDPEKDEITGYGKPELSFKRLAYGYDYANAKPLFDHSLAAPTAETSDVQTAFEQFKAWPCRTSINNLRMKLDEAESYIDAKAGIAKLSPSEDTCPPCCSRAENWPRELCSSCPVLAAPVQVAPAPALTKAECSMLTFMKSMVNDFTAEDWRQHGFSPKTYDNLKRKLAEL